MTNGKVNWLTCCIYRAKETDAANKQWCRGV